MTSTKKCTKCNGTGHIEAHSNIMGGICFKCWGKGTIETSNNKANTPKPSKVYHFAVLKFDTGKYWVIEKETKTIIAETTQYKAVQMAAELEAA